MSYLVIQHLHKKFEENSVLNDLSFQLEQHQILAILGKSGCGKTSLLKIIAGLLEADSGDIFLAKKNIGALVPQLRSTVYLYQEPLLFPHLNVFENIAFGLKIRQLDKKIIEKEVKEMLAALELEGFEKRMSDQLSGGQKQRIAFARALIVKPKLLLLDEPFGALDSETRVVMQTFFKKISSEHKITSIFVTHDLKEALQVGNTFALMDKGNLHCYDDKNDFIKDEKTGVQNEIEFWKSYMNIE